MPSRCRRDNRSSFQTTTALMANVTFSWGWAKIARLGNHSDKTVNADLIRENWDDLLRLTATIRLKESSASDILRRLNSYSRQHVLYQALKAFGQVKIPVHPALCQRCRAEASDREAAQQG